MPKGRKRGECYGSRGNVTRASERPSIRRLHWAAGFLEGEGSFSYSGGQRLLNGRKRNGGTEVLHAAQQNRVPLERLQSYFGGSISGYHPRPRFVNGVLYYQSRPYWQWHLSGARARGVMLTLFALLSQRRQEQIRSALTGRDPKLNLPGGRAKQPFCGGGHPRTAENTYRWKNKEYCRACRAAEAQAEQSAQSEFLKWMEAPNAQGPGNGGQ